MQAARCLPPSPPRRARHEPAHRHVHISDSRIFYVTDSRADVFTRKSNIVSDAGNPPSPEVFRLVRELEIETTSTVFLNALGLGDGRGHDEVGVVDKKGEVAELYRGTFAACREVVSNFGWQKFVIVKHERTAKDHAGKVHLKVPVVQVRLLPQCATLNAVSESMAAAHEFVVL